MEMKILFPSEFFGKPFFLLANARFLLAHPNALENIRTRIYQRNGAGNGPNLAQRLHCKLVCINQNALCRCGEKGSPDSLINVIFSG